MTEDSGGYRPLNGPFVGEEGDDRVRPPVREPIAPGGNITFSWDQAVGVAEALICCARHHDVRNGKRSLSGGAMRLLPIDVIDAAMTSLEADPTF